MTKTVRVNVRHAINSATIRRERRDGRDYIVVPSATMPDGIVMNRVRYSGDEIAKSFASLENTPAPLGHPSIEGAFVSAKDPEGLARGWVGAWNRNVRRENGRVFLDKVIDVATASQLDGGKTLLNAIEKGEPIHSSTGLYAIMTAVNGEEGIDWDASDIVFDHDAILVGEPGAASPEQGVGLMVNAAVSAGGKKVDVINSTFDDDIEREIEWAAESIVRVVERKEQQPLIEQIKSYMMGLVKGAIAPKETESDPLTANGDDMDKAQFDALSAKVDALAASPLTEAKVAEIVGNALKPIADAFAAQETAAKAKDEAERLDLVNKVVESGLLEQEVAKDATTPVLNALLSKGPATAFRVNGAFKPATGGKPSFTAPKGE